MHWFRGVTVWVSKCVGPRDGLRHRALIKTPAQYCVAPSRAAKITLTFWSMNIRPLGVFCGSECSDPFGPVGWVLGPEQIRLTPASRDCLIGLESEVFGGLVDSLGSVSGVLELFWSSFCSPQEAGRNCGAGGCCSQQSQQKLTALPYLFVSMVNHLQSEHPEVTIHEQRCCLYITEESCTLKESCHPVIDRTRLKA